MCLVSIHRSLKLSGQRRDHPSVGKSTQGIEGKRRGTYGEVLFISKHKLRCARIIGAVGLINDEFFFLLFRMGQRAKRERAAVSIGQWETQIRDIARIRTHAFQEMLTPPLVLPGQFCRTLEADEKFPLEIEKLIQIRKEKMDRVLVNDVGLGERV